MTSQFAADRVPGIYDTGKHYGYGWPDGTVAGFRYHAAADMAAEVARAAADLRTRFEQACGGSMVTDYMTLLDGRRYLESDDDVMFAIAYVIHAFQYEHGGEFDAQLASAEPTPVEVDLTSGPRILGYDSMGRPPVYAEVVCHDTGDNFGMPTRVSLTIAGKEIIALIASEGLTQVAVAAVAAV
jgi:hypothetical protein